MGKIVIKSTIDSSLIMRAMILSGKYNTGVINLNINDSNVTKSFNNQILHKYEKYIKQSILNIYVKYCS